MKRKDYMKPMTQVILLYQQYYLLSGSPQGDFGERQNPEEQNWP